MKITIVTPLQLGKKSGNSISAIRWAKILRDLGHSVSICNEYRNENTDLMIALNAYRSASSISTFKEKNPRKPLIVVLTGTDIYKFIHSHQKETVKSIEIADKLLVLNALAYKAIPKDQRNKVFLIFESAKFPTKERRPNKRFFDICIIGHLRDEKDSLLTAKAVRMLPESSKIRVHHYGKAHTEEWAEKARLEMTNNKRYTWFGEVAHWKVRQALSKCNLMVLSSKMEGGPNSLSEAVVTGVPVITTDIDGCKGVLGEEYQGYFPVGDRKTLRDLLIKAESDPIYLNELENYVLTIASQLSPEVEKERWKKLMSEWVEL